MRLARRAGRRLPARIVGSTLAGAQAAERGRAVTSLITSYGAALGAPDDLTRFEHKVFARNGEDGILAELLSRVGPGSRHFVEFGAWDGREGNCVFLADVLGWSGLFIECDQAKFADLSRKYASSSRVTTRCAAVDASNVERLFADAGVPPEPDVVSIDVDGNDWWIWRALVSFRPRIVVIEYNANLEPGCQLVKPYDPTSVWDETSWFGASLGAFERLAEEKGYRLVYTDLRGVNAFFVRDDLMDLVGPVNPPRRTANYDLAGARIPGDPTERPWVNLEDGMPPAIP